MQWESISRKWKRRAWPFRDSSPLSPISSVPCLVLNLFLSQIFALDQSLEAGQVWQGASHLLPSKANRESERGGSWHLGGLPALHTLCQEALSMGVCSRKALRFFHSPILFSSHAFFIVSNQGSSLFQRFPLLVRRPVGWLRITSPQRQFVDCVLSLNECEVWWWRMVSKVLYARFDLWTIGPLC